MRRQDPGLDRLPPRQRSPDLRAQPPRVNLHTAQGPATATPPGEPAPAGVRWGLLHPIPAKPKVVKGNFFLGTKATDRLPALMMQATERGPVLSVATGTAVMAAFGRGPGRVVVADLSQRNLAGVQDLLQLAKDSPDQAAWLASVQQRYGTDVSRHFKLSIKRAGDHASFERLKARVESGQIDFFHVDLADVNATRDMRAIAGEGFAAVYASNIEQYVGGHLDNTGAPAQQRQQRLDQYRTNLLGVMRPDGDLVRGSVMGRMTHHKGTAEVNAEWNPTAS
ncbi:hypothetical protein HLB44_34850 [Aquincola sp. S2]|uniref:Uncharacterized protein n=1 Tax=Pseudaquabacterium terrae TaxID=2732868 RepID=A0ABX2EUP0_9BURK|nr:hypothetical protein [Aquabacterium terrae]NRF72176.1 hypothetical protein [Aquabacterium terrae]